MSGSVLMFLLVGIVAVQLCFGTILRSRRSYVRTVCPKNPLKKITGNCPEVCDGDKDCRRWEKCCPYGCGHKCMKACTTPRCPRYRKCKNGYKTDKKGCPTCQCDTVTITCANVLCVKGKTCQMKNGEPVCVDITSIDKPGKCPTLPPGTIGICVELCSGDASCPRDQKCCSNGCGHVCKDPVKVCKKLKCQATIKCKYGFKLLSNGCEGCICNINPCLTVKCSKGQKCVVKNGKGVCEGNNKCPHGKAFVNDKGNEVICGTGHGCSQCPNGYYCEKEDGQKTGVCCDLCTLPSEPGTCKAYIPRYFFNKDTKACEKFIYGGCGGNANNFQTKAECTAACGKDICSLPLDPGPCRGSFVRYFWNVKTNKCERFTYGGCKGNANNFDTKEKCESECGSGNIATCPDGGSPLEDLQDEGVQIFCGRGPNRQDCPPNSYCNIDPTDRFAVCCPCPLVKCSDPCPAGFELDEKGCQTCTCVDVCKDVDCKDGEVCVPFQVQCVTTPCPPQARCVDLCTLPPKVGPCEAAIKRYSWNKKTKSCQKFIYGGCQGNANNFKTIAECEAECKPDEPMCPFGGDPLEDATGVRVFCGRGPNRQDCPPNYSCNIDPADRFAVCCLCPQIKCSDPCPAGFEVDDKGCPTCNCIDVCKNTECKEGEVCVPVQVQCVTTPCPPQPQCVDLCTLPPETGPCRAIIGRYFWNKKTRKCDKFTYGGCKGNANNFKTLEGCRKACGPECPDRRCPKPCPFGFMQDKNGCPTCTCIDACALVDCKDGYVCVPEKIVCITEPCIAKPICVDLCTLPAKIGPCDADEPRFFWNTKSSQCERFQYGGCEGNANNFQTKAVCMRACGPPCPLVLCKKPCKSGFQNNENGCQTCTCKNPCENFECKPGQYCIVAIPGCLPSYFCPPHPNCVDCPAVLCKYQCKSGYKLDKRGCQTCDCKDPCENFKCDPGKVCVAVKDEPQCIDLCTLPAKIGPCDAVEPRFFWNTKSSQCERFQYGGCEGNANNFHTKAVCMRACGPPCPPVLCKKPCKSGFQNDENGCQICTCNDPCENFECKPGQFCIVAMAGCLPSYYCPPSAHCFDCPAVLCKYQCKSGYKLDKRGCQTCDCKDPCENFKCDPGKFCVAVKDEPQCIHCPQVDCLPDHVPCVKSGYKLTKDGCQTCACNDPCEGYKCEFGKVCHAVNDKPQCIDCPQIDCVSNCKIHKLDKNGCETCECEEPVKKCPCGEPLKDANGKELTCNDKHCCPSGYKCVTDPQGGSSVCCPDH